MDYKRLVSYIYACSNGEKIKNVGFAKAEVRNGQCKMQINLKGIYTDTPETYGVHVLVREKEDVIGIRLGNIVLKNGLGNYQDVMLESNIKSSGYPFQSICGIMIGNVANKSNIFVSQWEEEEFDIFKIVFPEEVSRQNEEIIETAAGEKAEKKEEDVEVSVENTANQEEKKSEFISSKSINNEFVNSEMISSQPVKQENSNEEYASTELENNSVQETAEQNEPNIQSVSAVMEHATVESAHAKEEIRASEFSQNNSQAKNSKSEYQTSYDYRQYMPQSFEERNMSAMSNTAQIAVKKEEKKISWEDVFKNADFIDAFNDDYLYDCIEVSPDILKRLPFGEENIVNNSFLMHGYFNYRHVIFGRVCENANNTKYFVGIPGTYCNRERVMASMYGFNNFKKSHRSDCRNPYFGYWYMEI